MHINNSILRIRGERISLLLSFLFVFLLSIYIFEIDLWLILVGIILQLVYVVLTQKQLIGNSLLVNKNQFPDIYEIAANNAEELNIEMPNIFVSQDPYLNAFTIGFSKPYSIVLNSSLVESLNKEELDFVIGHEMGHIKFGHSKYLSLISPVGSNIPFISWFYADWQRRSEYTSDRVGYTLTHNLKPAITSMIKMSVGSKLAKVVDINEVINQIDQGSKGLVTKSGELLLSHPYTTNRIIKLVEFSHFEENYHK